MVKNEWVFRIFILLFAKGFVIGCGHNSPSVHSETSGMPPGVKLGVSSSEDVIKEEGKPLRTYGEKSNQVIAYSDQKSYQFSKNVLKGFFRDPEKDETYLQFWLQKWKNKKTFRQKLARIEKNHEPPDFQLNCPEEKTTVVYNGETGLVKRVMVYEQ